MHASLSRLGRQQTADLSSKRSVTMLCSHAWQKPEGQSLYEICENHARRRQQQQSQHRKRRSRQGQQLQSGEQSGDHNIITITRKGGGRGQPRHGRTLTQSSIGSLAATSDGNDDDAVETAADGGDGKNSGNKKSNSCEDTMKEAMARIVDLLSAEDEDLKGLENYACVFATRQARGEAGESQKEEDEEEMGSHYRVTPNTLDVDQADTETDTATTEKSTSTTTADFLTSVSSIALLEQSTTPATSTSTELLCIIEPEAIDTRASCSQHTIRRDVEGISPNADDQEDTRKNGLQVIQSDAEQKTAVAAIKSLSPSQSARAAVDPISWSPHELDGFLFFLWTASRGDQTPLIGCKPYTFRLPLPYLDWKQCIGTEQDVRQVEILLGYSDIRMQIRSGVGEPPCHLAVGSVDQESDMAELVVFPTIRENLGGKVAPGTVFRLNQAYDLCLGGFYNELHTRKCNVRLVDYLQERFELMNQAVRMATLAHKTGSEICKVAGGGG